MADSRAPTSVPMENGGSGLGDVTTTSIPHPCLQTEFDALFQYKRPQKPGVRARVAQAVGGGCAPARLPAQLLRLLLRLFPALRWLPRYSLRSDLLPDIVSGFTVAVMHIPQGMAYAMLANVMPIIGLYMAFFPVLLYVFMATSRHISMGSFAVVCMMASKAVQRYATLPDTADPVAIDSINASVFAVTSTTSAPPATAADILYTPEQVVTVLCLGAGAWQVALGLLRLGGISVFMSDTLVSGFTTAAAVHVMSSQVKNLLGLRLPQRNGPLKIVYLYADMAQRLNETNLVALATSACFVTALTLYNELVKPRLARRLSFPLPVELAAVVTGTLISYFLGLNQKLATLGAIPTGLPGASVPPLQLLPPLLVDSLLIAVVAFSINMSMASIFARKEHYSVDANQELLASGFSNVLGAFFCCIPAAASLSRSLIQHAVGGRTQVASLVSCGALLLVLLVLGPFFEPLPNCVLASIVVVALKGMLVQITDVPAIWRRSRADGIVWVSTFLSVILIDIDYGLFIGIAFSLTSVIVMGQKPKTRRLGQVPDTDIYLDCTRYHAAMEIPGVSIIQIAGGLHFANKDYLSRKLPHMLHVQEKEASCNSKKMDNIKISMEKQVEAGDELSAELLGKENCALQIQFLILDMSSVCFADPSSLKGLETLYEDFKAKGVILCLADCPAQVYERMVNCDFFWKFPDAQLFASVHDAVIFCQKARTTNVSLKRT